MFCKKALTTLLSDDIPRIFILGGFISVLSKRESGVPRQFRREQTGPFPLQMLGTSRQTELMQRAQGASPPTAAYVSSLLPTEVPGNPGLVS